MTFEQPQTEIRNGTETISLEAKQDLIDQHMTSIKAMATDNFYDIKGGKTGDVSHELVFRSGKQQPVRILKLSFEDGQSFDAVFRQTTRPFAELYEKYEAVRELFPHMFAAIDASEDSHKKSVIVSERISGIDEKQDGRGFEELIADPEKFDQLCNDVYDAAKRVLSEPLMIHDVNAVIGHNVIYNTDNQRFQFFDVDTVAESDLPFVNKFMDFVDPGQKVLKPEGIRFVMQMIKKYAADFPDASLQFEGNQTKRRFIKKAEEAESEVGTIIDQSDEGYADYYRAIDWRGTMGRTDLPPLKLMDKVGRPVTYIRHELVDASIAGDFERAKEIIDGLGGRIREERFEETLANPN